MGKLKAGLTSDEHRQLGDQLKGINRELNTLACRLSIVYPVNSKVVKVTNRSADVVGDLRCELDRLAYQEQEAMSPDVYY